MKEFADDNFKFYENGRKFSKRIENAVGKGEITQNEQFSFTHSVLKRLVLQTRKNQGLFWKGLIILQTHSNFIVNGSIQCPRCMLQVIKPLNLLWNFSERLMDCDHGLMMERLP